MVSAPKPTIKRARKLRREMSLPEVLLWNILRQRPNGLKFRHQHPIGTYVLDFYCLEHKCAVEIDGIAHDMGDRPERDAVRDDWLKRRGIHVMRIAAPDVLADATSVADAIITTLGPQE